MKSETRLTAIFFQHLSTESIKPCLSQALLYDLSLTLLFTKCLSPGRRICIEAGVPWELPQGDALPSTLLPFWQGLAYCFAWTRHVRYLIGTSLKSVANTDQWFDVRLSTVAERLDGYQGNAV